LTTAPAQSRRLRSVEHEQISQLAVEAKLLAIAARVSGRSLPVQCRAQFSAFLP
jgi:hypothetical protein